jgi:hypothetical protein
MSKLFAISSPSRNVTFDLDMLDIDESEKNETLIKMSIIQGWTDFFLSRPNLKINLDQWQHYLTKS